MITPTAGIGGAGHTDRDLLDEADVAFDPVTQHLDLTKDEKRRTTALMLAIQAYKQLLIPDAAYLREAADLARRNEGPKIQPATIDAMIVAAFKFDRFILGADAPPAEDSAPTDQPGDQP